MYFPDPSIRTGMCPVSLPASQVWCSRATSSAMSAPELPTPTRRTPPSRSCDGRWYWLEWNWTIEGSSSVANEGTLGIRFDPVATMTLSASKTRPSVVVITKRSSTFDTDSTRVPVRRSSSNVDA